MAMPATSLTRNLEKGRLIQSHVRGTPKFGEIGEMVWKNASVIHSDFCVAFFWLKKHRPQYWCLSLWDPNLEGLTCTSLTGLAIILHRLRKVLLSHTGHPIQKTSLDHVWEDPLLICQVDYITCHATTCHATRAKCLARSHSFPAHPGYSFLVLPKGNPPILGLGSKSKKRHVGEHCKHKHFFFGRCLLSPYPLKGGVE